MSGAPPDDMPRPLFILALLALAGLGWLGFQLAGWRSAKLAGLEVPPAVELAAVSPATPPALLLFGDSRVAQWKPLPDRPYSIAAEGFPGETAIRLAARFPDALQQHRPQLVMLQLGVNDAVAASQVGAARREQALADSLSAIERMAADAKAAGADLVILKVIPPVRPELPRRLLYRGEVDAYVAALNAALPSIAARHGATVADPLPLLADAGGAVPDRYRRDALHLTPEAYQALGALLPPSIEARG
jgi:lysophospholipase L1-like esterase